MIDNVGRINMRLLYSLRHWYTAMIDRKVQVKKYFHLLLHLIGVAKKANQNAVWVMSFGLEVPWAGMDVNACNYLEPKCEPEGVVTSSPINATIAYPIDINPTFPTVSI